MEKNLDFNDESNQRVVMGISLANRGSYKMVSGTQAVELCHKKKDKVAVVAGAGNAYDSMLGFLLGENLADALIIRSNMDPYSIMRTALSVNYGKGVLLICSNEKSEKENFLFASGLLEEAGIDSEVVFTSDPLPAESPEGESSLSIGADLFFCTKIAGAAAASGAPLKEIYKTVKSARAFIRSTGVGLHSNDSRTEAIVNQAVFQMIRDLNLFKMDSVCTYVSGYGGIDFSELATINYYLKTVLTEKRINIHDMIINPVTAKSSSMGAVISLFTVEGRTRPYYDMPCSSLYFRKG